MSLCYLHSESLLYPHLKILLSAFEKSITIDIETNTDNIVDDYDVYIIELNQTNKEVSQRLLNIFKEKTASLIYFIIPKNHTLMLFQLTFLLETKSIITYNQDVNKVILKIKENLISFHQKKLENWLGNVKINAQHFVIYKNNTLVFVSNPLLLTFKSKNSHKFEKDILFQVDITKLLTEDMTLMLDIEDVTQIKTRYQFKSLRISDNEKIIYIEKIIMKQEVLGFISSRVTFIELLIESTLQKNVSHQNLTLLAINITNIKKLFSIYKVIAFEKFLLDTLVFMESILETKLIFSEFKNNFYVVLFEDKNFQELNLFANHFYTRLRNYINIKNNKMVVDLFTLDLKGFEFNQALNTLNKIETENFAIDETNSSFIKYFTSEDTQINEKKLLDDAYKDKLNFKILNIYNGLVINTSSKIIKITDKYIYILFEPLQGVVLNIENKTVLQSNSFSQDIEAQVKQIHMSKKIAILENFKFLKTNANARQYARVTTPIKIPISINTANNITNGTIIDISIKSIAIKIKSIPKKSTVEIKNASLVFNIIDKASENGYIQLNLDAEVIIVTNIDENGYYKVICNVDQNSHDLDIILKYVYERQKELIIELKKMSKLN